MPSLPLPGGPGGRGDRAGAAPVDTTYAAQVSVEGPALVVPALAVVPQPPSAEVSNERRAALLQELAFLDD